MLEVFPIESRCWLATNPLGRQRGTNCAKQESIASELTSTSPKDRGSVGLVVLASSESSVSSGTCRRLCCSVPALVPLYGRDAGVKVGWVVKLLMENVLLGTPTGLVIGDDTLAICSGPLDGCSSETCCLNDSSSACSSFLLEYI